MLFGLDSIVLSALHNVILLLMWVRQKLVIFKKIKKALKFPLNVVIFIDEQTGESMSIAHSRKIFIFHEWGAFSDAALPVQFIARVY